MKINEMRSFTTLFLALTFLLFSCSKLQAVKVKFTNKTGQKLTHLTIGNKNIGRLNPNETSRTYLFNEISFDSGELTEKIKATINGEEFTGRYSPGFCATGIVYYESGRFEVEIFSLESNSKSCLSMKKKP